MQGKAEFVLEWVSGVEIEDERGWIDGNLAMFYF